MRGHEAARFYGGVKDTLDQEIQLLEQEIARTRGALEEVEKEWKAIRQTLSGVLVPALDAEALKQAEALTGFRGFSRRDPFLAMAKEEDRLRRTIAQVEADQRYQRRESLAGPHGSLTRKRTEAAELLDPWLGECRKFEDLEGFLELVSVGYDTPTFEERWWQPSYWRHWAAGDRICSTLGLADFGDDVLPAYEAARVPRDQWLGEVQRLDGEIGAVHALVQSRDQAAARFQELPAIYLAECREMLAEHLSAADPALLASWFPAEDRALQVGVRTLSGVSAKREALQEMANRGLPAMVTALQQDRAKAAIKEGKLSRPKKAHLEVGQVDAGWTQRQEKYRVVRQKIGQQRSRIVRFDSYQNYAVPADEALWWLAFSGGRPPGMWVPSWQTYYVRHPGAVIHEDVHTHTPIIEEAVAHEQFSGMGDVS